MNFLWRGGLYDLQQAIRFCGDFNGNFTTAR